MDPGENDVVKRSPYEVIFCLALSHGSNLLTMRLDRFWLSKFLSAIGIGLDSSHVTGVTDVFVENMWQVLKGEDERLGMDAFWDFMTKIAVRRQQALQLAERKRKLESEKAAILATAPENFSDAACLEQFIIRSIENYLEDSCGPRGDVRCLDPKDWSPMTRQVLQHCVAHVFDPLLLPLFQRHSTRSTMTFQDFVASVQWLVGADAISSETREMLEECFDESNLYDTRGMPTGSISEELELDEFVDAVVLFGVRSRATNTELVTVQAKAWAFFSEACKRNGIDPLPEIACDDDFRHPKPRLCISHPELVMISEFGCFLVAGAFFPDVFAEAEAQKRDSDIAVASVLAGPSREWKRRTVELSIKLHSSRFGRTRQDYHKHFAITVDGVESKMHATKRQNRYRIEVPLAVKASGYHPCCTAKMEDGALIVVTRMTKSVVVATTEPSSPKNRIVLERRPTVQALSQALVATMEHSFRGIAKDPQLGLTEDEFLLWFERVKAAPRSFSFEGIMRQQCETPLATLFRCYATAPGQALALSVDLDGYYVTARVPAAPATAPMYMTFPNTVAATWTTFMACQGDVVPSAERFFDLSFEKLGPAAKAPIPVTLPAIGNLVVAPFVRVVHQRKVARAAAIREHEAGRVVFDYAHPNPLTNDQSDETPLSLAEKHGTISTSKEVLRANVRAVSDSLKSEYFAQQMVRLL